MMTCSFVSDLYFGCFERWLVVVGAMFSHGPSDYCSKTFRPVVNLYSECCTADVSDHIVSVERKVFQSRLSLHQFTF